MTKVRSATFFALLYFSVALFAGEEATVILPCKVYKSATRDSNSACRLNVRSKILLTGEERGRYVGFTGGACEGFVARRCLAVGPELLIQPEKTAKKNVARTVAEVTTRKSIRIGANGGAGFLFGSVSYSTSHSTGIGFSGGLELKMLVSERFALRFSTGLLLQGLSRTIDATGSLSDPSSVEYAQNYTYLTMQATGAYRLSGAGKQGGLIWSVAAGGEFLLPLSATQTSSLGTEVSFAADTLIFALLGPSVLYSFPGDWDLDVSVLGAYNITGTSGSSALGIRLVAAMTLGI